MQVNRRVYSLLTIIGSLSIAACLALIMRQPQPYPLGKLDSIMFRTGAELVGPNLYRVDAQRQLQRQDFWAPYFRAPFYALLLRPLLRWDFPHAWLYIRLFALGLFIILLPKALGIQWFAGAALLTFTPLYINFRIEQDAVITLWILSVTLLLERHGYQVAAGAVLALTLQKPTLFVLLPILLAVQRRWRILAGYAVAALFLIGLSLWIIRGLEAAHDYIDLVKRFPLVAYKMPTARGVADSLKMVWSWPLLVVPGLLVFAYSAPQLNFTSGFCLAVTGSLWLSPQSYVHDLAILALPICFCIFAGNYHQRIVASIYLIPYTGLLFVPPPPWSMLNGLLVLFLLLTWLKATSSERQRIHGIPTAVPPAPRASSMCFRLIPSILIALVPPKTLLLWGRTIHVRHRKLN